MKEDLWTVVYVDLKVYVFLFKKKNESIVCVHENYLFVFIVILD